MFTKFLLHMCSHFVSREQAVQSFKFSFYTLIALLYILEFLRANNFLGILIREGRRGGGGGGGGRKRKEELDESHNDNVLYE